MRSVDVVVATGGPAMVKSAYSSGKPSYGVGAGNVPVIIDRGVDLKEAVGKIVTGAAFDNGIICSHEQFVLTPEESFNDTVELFTATGKVWYTSDETQIQELRDPSDSTLGGTHFAAAAWRDIRDTERPIHLPVSTVARDADRIPQLLAVLYSVDIDDDN
jgi:hypothetical protein